MNEYNNNSYSHNYKTVPQDYYIQNNKRVSYVNSKIVQL